MRLARVAGAMRVARGRTGAVRAALDRPRLWRVTAALSALLLSTLLLAGAQGSLTIIARPPAATGEAAAATPPWAYQCNWGSPRQDRKRLAFCARVDGRVIASTHGPGPQEEHVAVLSDFHLVIVRLPEGAAMPAWGSRVVAVGPLFRARDGQRELQAFRLAAA